MSFGTRHGPQKLCYPLAILSPPPISLAQACFRALPSPADAPFVSNIGGIMPPCVQKAPVGSFERDIADGEYTLKWNSLERPVDRTDDPLDNINPQAGASITQDHSLYLDYILHTLQYLKNANVAPSAALTDSLRTLDNSLNAAVGDQILLPKAKKRWGYCCDEERAKKRTHTDPYAGGQASGKPAQPDAGVPKELRLSEPVVSTSHIEPSPQVSADPSEDWENDLSVIHDPQFPHMPNEDRASVEQRLMEALAL
ncbi:hypothetical protein B0H19DRAFT_1247722 [Mycena capillaripes]|nr:hypothetical protein B0H19DRAFT_1247722 [Mycena capillaripes]